MAIRITRIDDIDGSDGAEAIGFELDHKTYEIDLCVRNKIRFFRTIEPFIEHARLVREGEGAPKITTIVRRASDDYTETLGDSPVSDSSTQGAGTLDLIEMARQVEG